MKSVSSYRRCKCREDGRELGADCPKLRRRDGSWNPSHGTWYGKAELTPAPDRKRVTLRAGGFGTQEELADWFGEALALLAIPAKGPRGHEARTEILAMIRGSRRVKACLPRPGIVRLRYATGAAFKPGDTGDYLIAWLAKHELAGDWSPVTLHNYRRTIERVFLPVLGGIPLEDLTADDILKALAALDTEADRIRAARASQDPAVRKSVAGLRPPGLATKKRYLAVIRSALGEAAAIEEGKPRLLAANVAAGIKFRKGGGKGRAKSGRVRPVLWSAERERKWRAGYGERAAGLGARERFEAWRSTAARPGPVMVWRPEHLGKFLDTAEAEGSRMYAAFSVIGYCALRRGEVTGQKWPDVDLDAGAFMVGPTIIQVGWAAVEKDDGKTDLSEDWIRPADEVTAALRAVKQRQREERLQWGTAWRDTGYVHTHEDGTPYHPEQVSGEFERIAYRAGLPPVTLRDLRHCAPTFALSAGVDIKVVCEMMRHSSVKTTADIYALVLPELAAEVSRAVASMIPRQAAAGGSSETPGLPPVSRPRTESRSLRRL